ncbi:MAG: dihydrodipicolinate synthase family protein [Trueperaceae bacterium]
MTRRVLAATLTPFRTDGSLWLERIPDYLRFLTDRGVDGFLALGTNGEFASLSVEERERVLEAHVAAAEGRRVLVNVGTTVAHDVERLARHARSAGADGVTVLPPYYFPLTERGFHDLALRAANAFSGPVFLYNIPRYTGFSIPVRLVAALAADGTIIGIKDSSQDLDYLRSVREAAPGIEFLMGSDTTLIEGLVGGATGVASGMANTFPELVAGTTHAFERGGDLTAWEGRIREIRSAFARYPYLAATRHAVAARGMDVGPVRAPLSDLTNEERDALVPELSRILAGVDGLAVNET